jgi:hypothetical protein
MPFNARAGHSSPEIGSETFSSDTPTAIVFLDESRTMSSEIRQVAHSHATLGI